MICTSELTAVTKKDGSSCVRSCYLSCLDSWATSEIDRSHCALGPHLSFSVKRRDDAANVATKKCDCVRLR